MLGTGSPGARRHQTERIVSVEGVFSVRQQDIRANPVVLAGWLGIGETSTGVNSWFVMHTARQK